MSNEQADRYAFSEKDLALDLKKLMLLKVLLETESLAKASAYLGIAVSTASRDLSLLRNIFKDPLFTRSSNRMIPTAKMSGLGDTLEKLFSNVGDLLDLNRQGAKESEFFCGTIRVAANDNSFSVFIGSLLPAIARRSSRFKVEVYPASMGTPEAMRRGLIDFLIAQDPFLQLDSNFHSKELLSSPHVVCVRRGHPALNWVREEPERCLSVIERYAVVQTPISLPSGFSGLPPVQREVRSALLQTPYFISSLFLASKSDATVICPRVLLKTVASSLPLEYVEIPDAEPWRPTLYWHERTHNEPLHQCFRGLLEMQVQELVRMDGEC